MSWPVRDVLASRDDAALQARHTGEVEEARRSAGTVSCAKCGAAGDALQWFYFESPPVTWQHLAGRAGVIAWCPVDEEQVHFVLLLMN